MNELEVLISELEGSIPAAVEDAEGTSRLGITDAVLEVPVEARLGDGASLALCLPRGRLATGFDVPHGRLRITFVRGGA